jgi:DMSO/TMAO reductase YedYZ molybdopterin-dependent catalytic subunit
VPLADLLTLYEPEQHARCLAFHAFDDKTETGEEGQRRLYYGTIPLSVARRPQTILALEMNDDPLPVEHGAPMRLRVESQLGFKIVKWIRSIELVYDYDYLGEGQGGWREDHQYYTTWGAI